MRLWHPRTVQCEQEAATKAVERSAQNLKLAEGRADVVADLTSKLRDQGIRNNFIERLNMHVARKET